MLWPHRTATACIRCNLCYTLNWHFVSLSQPHLLAEDHHLKTITTTTTTKSLSNIRPAPVCCVPYPAAGRLNAKAHSYLYNIGLGGNSLRKALSCSNMTTLWTKRSIIRNRSPDLRRWPTQYPWNKSNATCYPSAPFIQITLVLMGAKACGQSHVGRFFLPPLFHWLTFLVHWLFYTIASEGILSSCGLCGPPQSTGLEC